MDTSHKFSKELPEPFLIKAGALLKKNREKSIKGPLAVLPSTRMCFSGKCQPRGRTIKVACCITSGQGESAIPG